MDTDFYPVKERLIAKSHMTSESILLVDQGGGLGHDLAEFFHKHPDLQGRLILQDKPDVIDSIGTDLDRCIERMPHDFFTPQPIQGKSA